MLQEKSAGFDCDLPSGYYFDKKTLESMYGVMSRLDQKKRRLSVSGPSMVLNQAQYTNLIDDFTAMFKLAARGVFVPEGRGGVSLRVTASPYHSVKEVYAMADETEDYIQQSQILTKTLKLMANYSDAVADTLSLHEIPNLR